MCGLLEISPAPNNGTEGALNHVLKKPSKYSPPQTKALIQPSTYPHYTDPCSCLPNTENVRNVHIFNQKVIT